MLSAAQVRYLKTLFEHLENTIQEVGSVKNSEYTLNPRPRFSENKRFRNFLTIINNAKSKRDVC